MQRRQPKPGYFRQFIDPGQDVSQKNGTSGHLNLSKRSLVPNFIPGGDFYIYTIYINCFFYFILYMRFTTIFLHFESVTTLTCKMYLIKNFEIVLTTKPMPVMFLK